MSGLYGKFRLESQYGHIYYLEHRKKKSELNEKSRVQVLMEQCMHALEKKKTHLVEDY